MIIPTLGCPGQCKYCWSSDVNSPQMTIDTAETIVRWLEPLQEQRMTVTFHGGEPMLVGSEFYRCVLPLIESRLAHLSPEFAMQTNLWLMTDEFAEILAEHHVPLGSSIDGPEILTNSQRGDDYFARTMAGYRIAIAHGLLVRFICTFINSSIEQKEEIFRFFQEQRWVMKLHPALPSLKDENPNRWSLSPEEYGKLLVYLLDEAILHVEEFEIMNINDLCRSVFLRSGSVCTFADCMGATFAVGPDGAIYPCYRFVGMPKNGLWGLSFLYLLLVTSPAGRCMRAFKDHVNMTCHSCAHITYCRDVCPYNAFAGTLSPVRDVVPHCIAYKRIFDEITFRIESEMTNGVLTASLPNSCTSRVRGNAKASVMKLIKKIVV
ncbi:MAG TPA: TIGR04083 family peptide-modifying radical SAM enzyme [Methanocorpusculum sp.]|nr:TIGR04083 family peptide-modifying radical SAM enzyme [Methanocorpusculum sp.]